MIETSSFLVNEGFESDDNNCLNDLWHREKLELEDTEWFYKACQAP